MSLPRMIIVAGPQAAGKSTAITLLAKRFPAITFLQEMRQIVTRERQINGGICMSALDEVEVILRDLSRLLKAARGEISGRIVVDETSFFTIAHARAHGIDALDGYLEHYQQLLEWMEASVIFLDVPPDISWLRRKDRYAERLQAWPPDSQPQIMIQFRTYLEQLHPELLRIYERIRLPKILVTANGSIDEVQARLVEFFSLEPVMHFIGTS